MPKFSDYIVYVDESGDHNLQPIDKYYPVFVLSCCIFEKSDYSTTVSPRIQNFKFKYFGHDIVILHEHKIRKQRVPFKFLQNRAKRSAFMTELSKIVKDAPFTLVAAVIDKQRLTDQYAYPENPYEIALRFCMERTYALLKDRNQHSELTHWIVEERGKREDQELELAFRRICDGDNQWGRLDCFDIIFADKKTNSSGLQLADLTARPIGRHVLDPGQPNRAYDIIETKFRRSPRGEIEGWGLKVFPEP